MFGIRKDDNGAPFRRSQTVPDWIYREILLAKGTASMKAGADVASAHVFPIATKLPGQSRSP